MQRWRDPLFLRCEQGANTAQNGTGFKNVSCESAYRQLWELFLKWEEAVITSPSVAPCATVMIFVLEVHFDMLSPFPHFPPPHSGKQTWCSLTSAFAVWGRKWGEFYNPLWSKAAPAITQAGLLSAASWWMWREDWFLVVRCKESWIVAIERPPVQVSSEGLMGKLWPASSFFVDRHKRSDEWQHLVLSWKRRLQVF